MQFSLENTDYRIAYVFPSAFTEYMWFAGRKRERRFASLRIPARWIDTLTQRKEGLLSPSHLGHERTVIATVALLTNGARFSAAFSSSHYKADKGGF